MLARWLGLKRNKKWLLGRDSHFEAFVRRMLRSGSNRDIVADHSKRAVPVHRYRKWFIDQTGRQKMTLSNEDGTNYERRQVCLHCMHEFRSGYWTLVPKTNSNTPTPLTDLGPEVCISLSTRFQTKIQVPRKPHSNSPNDNLSVLSFSPPSEL